MTGVFPHLMQHKPHMVDVSSIILHLFIHKERERFRGKLICLNLSS